LAAEEEAMLTWDLLAARPAAFVSLTGLSPAAFDVLAAEFAPAYQRHRAAATTTRRDRQLRQRAPGAGGGYVHDLRTRLLMALVWLKVYPTYEVLGLLFSLHKRNAQLNVRDLLEVLETLDDFPFDRPPADRPKLASLAAVMGAYPAVRLVIDSKEQRLYRPGGGHARQKPFYSGKKKAHTLKTQLAVSPGGLIESVSPGVPGTVNDVRLLRESGLLDRLGEREAAMTDKGYEGASKGRDGPEVVQPQKDRTVRPLTEAQKAENRRINR
jgi:DDE superfamily endonuclease